jgi:hypothetical protein
VHIVVSSWHVIGLQTGTPPGFVPMVKLPQVWPMGTLVSHCSEPSTVPLPQVALLLSDPQAPRDPAAANERANTTIGNLSFMTHILQERSADC